MIVQRKSTCLSVASVAKVWLFLTITSKHYYRSLTSRVPITRSLKRSTSSLAHLSLQILYNHIPAVISHNSWNTSLHSYICETGDICMWNICLLCKIVNACRRNQVVFFWHYYPTLMWSSVHLTWSLTMWGSPLILAQVLLYSFSTYIISDTAPSRIHLADIKPTVSVEIPLPFSNQAFKF